MNYYIITGAPRGLGEAIAKAVIKEGNHLIVISRSKNKELISLAKEKKVAFKYYQYDLTVVENLKIKRSNTKKLLINCLI